MKLESLSLANNKFVPPRNAMGILSDGGPVPGPNKSPHLAWSDFPAGTQSFAIVCVDPDAPARKDDATQADRTCTYDVERAKFYQWILVDIPASFTSVAEGADPDGLTPRGKPFG